MDRNKAPVNDFAPSWLKTNSFDKETLNFHNHHPHPNHHNFHLSVSNKGKLGGSPREDTSPVSGDSLEDRTKQGKGNSKNGFVDSKEEFPSLIDEKQVNVEANNGNSVWVNATNKVFRSGSSKVNLVSRHLSSSLYGDRGSLALNGENSMIGTGLSRSLVPVVPRRKNVNSINGCSTASKLGNSLSNLNLGSANKILPVFSKPVNHSSTSHSMAILAKKHPNKKNDSLLPNSKLSYESRPDVGNEQRSDDHSIEDDGGGNSSCLEESRDASAGDKDQDNGLDIKTNNEDSDVHLLSSSLEAEERLLREMGWKEEDEDENFYAPLTEDEVKEFKDLINKRKSSERYSCSKSHQQGRFKFQANSSQPRP